MTATAKPEIGSTVVANGIETNYLEDGSGDDTVLLIHGSGPGVTSYANWRLVIPALATKFRVIAPDMVGFGFSERPTDVEYNVQTWADQTVGVMDALGIEKASLVGNSFGGAIALRIATQHPERIDKLVLMGSMGVPFPITEGLERVWGYEASFENMRKVLDVFAYSRELVNDELAQVRYEGSIQPGFQEAFSSMFPAPRQRWVEAMCTPGGRHSEASAPDADHSRPRGPGHPTADVVEAGRAHRQCRSVRLFALRTLVDDRAKRRLQPRPARVPLEVTSRQNDGDLDRIQTAVSGWRAGRPRSGGAATDLRDDGADQGGRGPHGRDVQERRSARFAVHRALARGDLGRVRGHAARRRLHGADPPRPRRASVSGGWNRGR